MECESSLDISETLHQTLQTSEAPASNDLRSGISNKTQSVVIDYCNTGVTEYSVKDQIGKNLTIFREPETPMGYQNQMDNLDLINPVNVAMSINICGVELNHDMTRDNPENADVSQAARFPSNIEPRSMPVSKIPKKVVLEKSHVYFSSEILLDDPVRVEVLQVLEDLLEEVVGVENQQQSRTTNDKETADTDFLDEIPSSPEPDSEPETPIDEFLEIYVTQPEVQSSNSEQWNDAPPMKNLILTAQMDDEVAEVLQTYVKSQFGELRKRTAMHLLAIDQRVGSYQKELRKLSAPLLHLAHLFETQPSDLLSMKQITGKVLSFLRLLNEQMIRDRRRAILNFFERPDEAADMHRFPRKNGDALFGKRFCYFNGLGFTKRRPRRKPVQRTYKSVVSRRNGRTNENFVDETSHDECCEEYTELDFDEEDEDEENAEEEAVSDEDWKVSENEEGDIEEEEDEEESELESEEQDEIECINNKDADGKNVMEDMWSESMRLMQLAQAANSDALPLKKKREKTKRKKENSGLAGRRGRKRKSKSSIMISAAAAEEGDEDETKIKRKRRRRKSGDEEEGELNSGYRARKKDRPTIERKIDPHCEYCNFEADRRHLIMHVRKAHPDKMIQCEQCPKKFAFKVSLWNHVVIMHGTAKFKCTQCTRSFRSEEKLRMHSFMHSELKPFACEICGKGCLTKRHLDAHVLIHEQRQQLYCQMCNRFFATNHNFRNHMKLHTGQKDFFCDICNAGFPIKARLTQHKRLHHSGEQYVCDICGKAFKARHILNDHKALRHSTEKAWVCEVCGAGFKLKSVLVRHLKTHSDERPYRCDICDKAFKDRSTLGVHRKTHSTDRPYLCEQCGMSFKRNAERKKHNCIGRMVHIPEESSQSHQSQMQPLPAATNPQLQVLAQPNQPTHHIVMSQRPIQLTNIMPHPVTLMSPATPGTSLQAQIMQFLDENLHAAGSQHPQPPNFSVN